MNNTLIEVLAQFQIDASKAIIEPLNDGLINDTFKITSTNGTYILQRINTNVFKQPEAISNNIVSIGNFLKIHSPHYTYTHPEKTKEGEYLMYIDDKCYRLMPFIHNSVTYTKLSNEVLAENAAAQFAMFTQSLANFDSTLLKPTIPDFHNLTLRYRQFEEALINGNKERIAETASIIKKLQDYKWIADQYEGITKNPEFKLRVTHHDTKISNVLFDKAGNGICVIDLDTVMPGYFISDLGDMMRTYICSVSEEENDLSLVRIRPNYVEAVIKGYLKYMKPVMTDEEKKAIVYSGPFMIYMQALRFLTDYLNNDVYYGAKYPEHNLNRAKNQIALLESYLDHKVALEQIVMNLLRD